MGVMGRVFKVARNILPKGNSYGLRGQVSSDLLIEADHHQNHVKSERETRLGFMKQPKVLRRYIRFSTAFLRWIPTALLLLITPLLLSGCGFATLEHVLVERGDAQLKTGGKVEIIREGKRIPAKTGMTLKKDDVIQTGPDTSASIQFMMSAEVILRPNTRVRISSIETFFGEIFIKVKGLFDVHTEYATAGSEGTEYVVKVEEDGKVTVTVLEGKVKLKSKSNAWSPVRLEVRQQASLEREKRPDTRQISQENFNSTIEWINRIISVTDKGAIRLIVPDFAGMEQARAVDTIREAQLRPGQIQRRLTGSARVGAVLRQQPTANSRAAPGTPVDLVVEAEPTKVPSLKGVSKASAVGGLEENRLRLGTVTQVLSEGKVGTVAEQNPAAGSVVMVDSTVDLSIVAESELVPGLQGLSLEDARRRILSKRLRVGTISYQITGNAAAGQVLSQQPSPGVRVFSGSEVSLVVEAESALIPRLIGQSLGSAQSVLAQRNLVVGRVDERITGNLPVGQVMEQHPAPGARVGLRSQVNIVIEADSVVVPALVGRSQQQAVNDLRSGRLGLGRIDSRRSAHAAPGTVLNQSPAQGARVVPGTMVNLTVAAEVATVPNLINNHINNAPQLLQSSRLRLGQVSSRLSDRYTDGTILEQHPRPGEQVDPNTSISLVVTEAGVRVPQVINQHINNVGPTLSNHGLAYSTQYMTMDHYAQGTVIRQSPEAGQLVRRGEVVHLTLAKQSPKCTVPNVMTGRYSYEQAKQLLRNAGFKVQTQGDTSQYAWVQDQKPSGGTQAPCESTVVLFTIRLEIK